jgi:hypothetical protein
LERRGFPVFPSRIPVGVAAIVSARGILEPLEFGGIRFRQPIFWLKVFRKRDFRGRLFAPRARNPYFLFLFFLNRRKRRSSITYRLNVTGDACDVTVTLDFLFFLFLSPPTSTRCT